MNRQTSWTSLKIINQSAMETLKVVPEIASTSTPIEMKTIEFMTMKLAPHTCGSASKSVSTIFFNRCKKWTDKEYRQGYMEASVEQGIAWQIRANRKAKGWTQEQLALTLETTQSGISRLEDPEYGTHSIDTLLKLANAFDCALSVRFIAYSRLAEESVDLSEANLVAKGFDEEVILYSGDANDYRIER